MIGQTVVGCGQINMDDIDGRGCINTGGIRGEVVVEAVVEVVAEVVAEIVVEAVAAVVWFIDTGRSTKYY